MKVPNAVTVAMMKWIDSGCAYTEKNSDALPDMRSILAGLCGSVSTADAARKLKFATAATLAYDVGSGGVSVLAIPLLHALLNDDTNGIDWDAIVERFKTVPEHN